MGDGSATPGRKRMRVTAAQTAAFLDMLAATGNVRASARSAGVSAVSLYNRRRLDRAFAGAWAAAVAVACDRVEAAARSQAEARLAVARGAPPSAGEGVAVRNA